MCNVHEGGPKGQEVHIIALLAHPEGQAQVGG
jgi:hypothetical protein